MSHEENAMRVHAVLILAAGCLIAADKKDDAVSKEQKKLQGTWRVTRAVNAGKPASAKAIKEMRFVFQGNKVIIMRGDKEERKYTYTVDPRQDPKTITVTRSDKPGRGAKGTGIYSLTKGTLEICMDNTGKKRPQKFASEKENGLSLLVMKKVE
jgi:uncharacterized protein (TIGR03067 family)